jgi:hypothetical protein
MAQLSWVVYSERVVQIIFGNVVNMGNHMDSHPGTHSTYISCFDSTVLLLKIMNCLKSPDSSKGQASQYEKQQKAEKAQFGSFTQCVQQLLTLSYKYRSKGPETLVSKLVRSLFNALSDSLLVQNYVVKMPISISIVEVFDLIIP